jgi:hypothetical protein
MAKVGRGVTRASFCTGYSCAGKGERRPRCQECLMELAFDVVDALGNQIVGDLVLNDTRENQFGCG